MTRIGEPWRPGAAQERWDAIVIGSGIGGLAAAALLARHGGRRVLVLERHYTAGGFTHVFRRPDYEWDVGVHYVGGVHPGGLLRRIFDDVTDGALAWADMGDVYDCVVMGGERYEFPRGRAVLEAEIVRRFPDEGEAIRRYFALVEETVRVMQAFFQAKAMPALLAPVVRPLAQRRFAELAARTTREVLESLTANQRLIGVLTAQWGDYGLPPAASSFAIHALVTQHYFAGGSYPVGGAGRIAETILPVIEAAGGRVLINAEVDAVALEGRRVIGVRMAETGEVVRAPLVVSDAGVVNTFGRLLPADLPAVSSIRADLRNASPSTAHAALYVGLRGTARELGLPRANLWVHPDEHHERTVAAAAAAPLRPGSAFISFPSAKDPDFERRHPARATVEVAAFVPWTAFSRWEGTRWHKRGADYGAAKADLAGHLLAMLEAHVPEVRGCVEHAELSTPLSTSHFAAHSHGEIYGLAHDPARFRRAWLRPRTPVRGLFLTGADVASAGVAGALMGGVMCASAILRRNVLQTIGRGSHARRAA
jgi:all-trans-retinol 13,14-reductase